MEDAVKVAIKVGADTKTKTIEGTVKSAVDAG
jgi:hypothetical protein